MNDSFKKPSLVISSGIFLFNSKYFYLTIMEADKVRMTLCVETVLFDKDKYLRLGYHPSSLAAK